MKANYYFDAISSEADEIVVKSYGTPIMTFRKADFGGDYSELVGQKFPLGPFECADFDKITTVGDETHPCEDYPESMKDKWYEYARNLLNQEFINNATRLADVDPEKPVIYRYTFLDTDGEYKDLLIENAYQLNQALNKITSIFNFDLDLSQFNIAPEFEINCNEDTVCGYKVNSTVYRLSNLSTYIKNHLIKSFALPSNLLSINNLFNGCKKLTDISNLDLSNVTTMNSAFAFTAVSSNIEFDFSKVTDAYAAFSNCTQITEVGDVNMPLATAASCMFLKCSSLTKIGNIYTPNVNYASGKNVIPFAQGPLEQVGDITVDTLSPGFITNTKSNGILEVGNLTFNNTASFAADYSGNTLIIKPLIDSKVSKIGNIYSEGVGGNYVSVVNSFVNADVGAVYLPNYCGRIVKDSNGLINSIGPILINPSCGMIPTAKTAVAIPYYYVYINRNKRSIYTPGQSEGYNQWFDYYPNITENNKKYIHNITKSEQTFEYAITSVSKNISYDMPVSTDTGLTVDESYPYEIEITNIQVNGTSTASNMVNCKNVSFFVNENNESFIHIEIDNATDETVATFVLNVDLTYDATIEGHPFKGATVLKITGTVTTDIREDASLSIEVIDDEPESTENGNE